MFNLFIKTIKRSFDFNSRSSRSEIWSYLLTNLFIACVFIFPILLVIFLILEGSRSMEAVYIFDSLWTIVYLYFGFVGVPVFALTLRRLNDLNMSPWWITPIIACNNPLTFYNLNGVFLMCIMVLYSIAFTIILYFIRGTEGKNQHGPDPVTKA